jgi:hypothetical protein
MTMANFVSSALLAFQSKIDKKFNAAELRELQNPILRNGLKYSDFIIGNVQAVKESDKRSVYTYFLKKTAATNGTARSYAPTGVQGDSGQISLSWVTFSEPLGLNMQVGYDNVFDTMTLLDHMLMDKQRILRERIGTYIVQQLHNNRTQTAPYTATARNASWNVANFAFENTANDRDLFFENAASVMRQNKYYDKLDVVADPVIFKRARYDQSQAGGNAQNLAYQFQSYNPEGIMEHETLGNEVATAYASGCAIVLPQASFAVIPWIPKINREGYGDYEDFNGGFGTVDDATGIGLTYAVRGWAQKQDTSAAGGTVQDINMNLELSVDISFNVAPISNAGETAIYEFGQLQS